MVASAIVLLAFVAPWIQARISNDLNCTVYSQKALEFIYSPKAVVCFDNERDEVCRALYPSADPAGIYPEAGGNAQRPFNCYNSIGREGPQERQLKKAAIRLCPRTCGVCCQTSAYSCSNSYNPRITCEDITETHCHDINWRPLIAEDCPAACGFCDMGGCYDYIQDCDEDISICWAVGMQAFVNQYCRRTCDRCRIPTIPDPPGTGTKTCTSYIPDTSNACREWDAKYKFCTKTTSTAAQKRKYCATTCKIC